MVIIVYIKVTKCYQIMNVYKHNFGYLEVVRYHNNPWDVFIMESFDKYTRNVNELLTYEVKSLFTFPHLWASIEINNTRVSRKIIFFIELKDCVSLKNVIAGILATYHCL